VNTMVTDDDLTRLLGEAAGTFPVPAFEVPEQHARPAVWRRRTPQVGAAAAVVFVAAALYLADPPTDRTNYSFDEPLDTDVGWAMYNQHYWRRDWPGFVDFFFRELVPEPHSSKLLEDVIARGWYQWFAFEAFAGEEAA